MHSYFFNFFQQTKLQIAETELTYYSITAQDKFDKFCQDYYSIYKTNPYFVNNWYVYKTAQKFLNDIINQKLYNIKIQTAEDKIKNIEQLKILELGSGLGVTANTILLTFSNQKKKLKYYAIDNQFLANLLISKSAILNKNKLFTLTADWNNLPFKSDFDIIFGFDIIYELSGIQPLINCLLNYLKKNGIFFLANFENIAVSELLRALKKNTNFKISFKKKWQEKKKKLIAICFEN